MLSRIATSSLLVLLTAPVGALELVSAAEAALPDAPLYQTRAGVTRAPGIRVIAPPANVSTPPPIEITVRFEPRGGATIDPASVRLIYLKTPNINVTPRIAQHVKSDGLQVPDVTLPPGLHRFRVQVADSEGRVGSGLLVFEITAR